MLSFDEIKKRAQQSKRASADDKNENAWEELKARARKSIAASNPNAASDISKWFKGMNQIGERAQVYYGTDGYRAPDRELETSVDRYLSQAGEIRSLISANREKYADYEDMLKSVDDAVSYLNGLKTTLPSANDFYSQFEPTEEQAAEGRTAEDLYGHWKTDYDNRQKYGDLTYEQIQKKLNIMPEDSADYDWLAAYAPTLMTDKDYDREISGTSTKISNLEAVLEEYNRLTKQVSTTNPNTYANVRLAELRKLYGSSADIQAKLEELKATRHNYENDKKYKLLPRNEDFAEKSGYVSTAAEDWWSKATSQFNLGYSDLTYEYINNQDGIRDTIRRVAVNNDYGMDDYDRYDHLTADEVAAYNYLYSTQGKKSAEEYLHRLQLTLNQRYMDAYAKDVYDFAGKDFWTGLTASVASVPANLLSGGGYLDILGQKAVKGIKEVVTGEYAGPVDYNRPIMSMSVGSSATRSTVAQKIADSTGVIAMDEDEHPVLSRMLNGKSLGDVYQLGMSMVDSYAAAHLAPVIGTAGSTMLLSGSAATQTTLDKAAQGATDGQALTMGLLAGAFEYIFEKYEIENLLGADTNVLRKMGNQALTEGLGEGATSFANTVADILVMADQSDLSKNAAIYMLEHPEWTQDEAFAQALLDTAIDIGWDMVGGAITGSIMGGTESVLQNIVQVLDEKASAKQISAAAPVTAEKMENTVPGDGVKYSIKRTQNMSWEQQIAGALSKTKGIVHSDTLVLDETSAMLVNDGVASRKLAIPLSIISKAKSGKDASPSITDANLEDLQRGVRNAPIVINNPARNALVFVTDIQQEGHPVLVAFQQNVKFDGDDVHKATSIHLQMDVASMLKALPGDATVYVKNESELDAAAGITDSLRSISANIKFTEGMVTQPVAGVNGENVDPLAQLARETVEAQYAQEDGAGLDGISAEGRAIYGDQTVDIADIADAGNGKLTVKLTDGSTADISELSFPDMGEQELWQVIAKYADNAEAARMLLKEFRAGELDAYKYARGVEEGFLYGMANISRKEMEIRGSYVNLLDPMQRNMAYKQGQIVGERKARKRQEKLQTVKKDTSSKKGQLHFEGDRDNLTQRQKVSLQACEVIAKALGIDVYIFESEKNSQGKRVGDNGWYDPSDGSIHIDLHAGSNSEGVMVFTLAHELTHFIKDWSPVKFRTIAGFLAEQYVKQGESVDLLVRRQQQKADNDGRKLSYAEAHEEWVADSMEQMLTDGSIIEKLSMLQAKDASLVEKIKSFLGKFVQRLKAAYKGVSPQTVEGQIVSSMVDAAQELQDLFADALLEAGENFHTAEKNTTSEGGVRYQGGNTGYDGVDLANDYSSYTWDFLTAAKDMQVTNLPEVNSVRGSNGKVDPKTVISMGLENAKKGGKATGGKIFVKNTYTGRNLRIDTASIRHGLSGDGKRILTNARLGAVIGDVVSNAVPINALYNKATGVTGTYAMAAYAKDSQGREFVAIVTVEERNGEISGIDAYDVTHAVSGRQKNSSRADTKSQGVNPSTTAKISIADFLYAVKSTHQSILSADVLAHIGGTKNPSSYYSQQSKFSARDGQGVSDRAMLVDLFEQMVTNSNEYKVLQDYKKHMDEMLDIEEHLERVTAEIQRISFSEGPRDMETLNKLKLQQKQAVNRLNYYDSKLLSLEKSGVLKAMIERNRKKVTQQSYDKAREYYREKSEQQEAEIRQYYRESRRQATERHNQAEVRQRIRKDVQRLDSLLNKGTKEKNVKLELQDFAGAALRTAKGAFLKNYNEYDMVRGGVDVTLSREQKAVFARAQELLKELDQIRDQKNMEPAPDNMHERWDPEAALRRDDHEEALKKELAKNMAVLREAGVFRLENERIEDAVSDKLMDELMATYIALKDSESTHVREVFNSAIYGQMECVKKFLAGKAIKDMTAIELGELQKMYRMVLHTITTSNDLFAQKRKADVRKLGEETISQLQTPGKEMTAEIMDKLAKMGWANLKPETALEIIGSDTLTEMMQGLYRGEDTYARDLEHARQYAEEQGKKYGYKDWDLKKSVSFAGTKITLGQAMSLYAYTKRKQAQGHLEGEGFTHSSNVRIREALGKLPLMQSYIMNATKTHIVPKGAYSDVANLLTPEQRKYVDAMQEYLSKVMGAKGNEVSMQLYGVKLFEETMYFPLKTASEYREQALGATAGEVKLRNTGFTQKTVDGASNPIVLDSFEDVWAGHVDKMSLYHGFVLPMEDFDRVYNYRHTKEEEIANDYGEVVGTKLVDTNESVKVDIENKMGKVANEYIENLMKQLNGGVRGDSTEKLFSSTIRNFKKTAVLGSLSVAVQQPTAFIRAMAYLDIRDVGNPKDFLGKAGKPEGKIQEEMYKYAPVALMKRIGGFDPGLGRTTRDYVFDDKKGVTGALDKFLGKFPEKMDEWTWSYIWVCTKRQIHRQHPDLKINSEVFLQKVGERFSKIIRDTQVYDSVLTKSQVMRSKNVFLQMATAFMNEPTTSMDMYIRSTIQANRGKIKKSQAAKTYAAVVGSQILTSAVVAFVYAMRDDDEDETYWEKYLSAFVGKTWENTMPWYSIPFVKDVFSVFDGYSVERSDMSLIVDLYQGWQKLQSNKATPWEKTEAFAGSILNVFGIPLKNVSRDVRGIFNTVSTWFNGGVEKTGAGLRYAALEGLTGKKVAKSVQLQNAVVENDAKHILRVMASYSSESNAFSDFRSAVKAAFLQGDVTDEQAAEFLQVYASDDAAEAQEKVMTWSFLKKYPNTELTDGKILDYAEFAEPAGVSLEIYTKYVQEVADIEGDKAEDGKTVSGSRRNKVLAVIHKLPLTKKQKDALYFAEGYAESTLDEAPCN